jgi:hypothetical protein
MEWNQRRRGEKESRDTQEELSSEGKQSREVEKIYPWCVMKGRAQDEKRRNHTRW